MKIKFSPKKISARMKAIIQISLGILYISAYIVFDLSDRKIGIFAAEEIGKLSVYLLLITGFALSLIFFQRLKQQKIANQIKINLAFIGYLYLFSEVINSDKWPTILRLTVDLFIVPALFIPITFLLSLLIKILLFIWKKYFRWFFIKHWRKLLSVLKKAFLIIFGLAILLLIIFNRQIPMFIYNEYEWQSRVNNYFAEMALDDANKLVDLRTGWSDILISDQETARLPVEIDEAINDAIQSIEMLKNNLTAQSRLVKLLPKKYQEYHQLKLAYFGDYQQSFYHYKEVKDKEHWIYKMMIKINDASGYMQEMKIGYSLDTANLIAKDVQARYDQGWLTEDLKAYLDFKTSKLISFAELFGQPDITWEKIKTELKKRKSEPEPDFNQAFYPWREKIIDPQFSQGRLKYNSSLEKIAAADKFYTENKLNRDWISVILSIISKKYPKVK